MNQLTHDFSTTFLVNYPIEAARQLDLLPPESAADALAPLDPSSGAALLQRMNGMTAALALSRMNQEAASKLISATDEVIIARLCALLPEADAKRLMSGVPEEQRKRVSEVLSFPAGSAGHYMDAGTTPFLESVTIEDALRSIRQLRSRRVSDLMVCDQEGALVGVVPLQELVGADPDTTLEALVHRDAPSVHSMTTDEEVVALLNQHRLASLPVVDLDNRLLGVIRHDALVQAAQKAAGDDVAKMVGAGAEERALSSSGVAVRSRLPWLLINLVTAFAAAAVVGVFDATIAKFTALAVLLPVVAGQSGNTGAQALAVTSRGLALREIRTSHWFRVVRKEVLAAAINGIAVAVVTGAGVWVWSSNLGLCVVIIVSMVISMILAAIAGAIVPIVLSALGRDPATASSIILTTVTDIAGFFSFLGLATALSSYL